MNKNKLNLSNDINSKESESITDIAYWNESMRAMPNDCARSSLFTVRHKSQPRRPLQGHQLYSTNNDVKVTYTGIELRAEDDELVWQQVIDYAKEVSVGTTVKFTFYKLCKDIGWQINGRYYKKAEECLTRLQASALQFQSTRLGKLDSFSLISYFNIDRKGTNQSECQVKIDREILLLFSGHQYSRFEWQLYIKLTPIARRLFDYISTHKNPYPLHLDNFQLLCSSDTKRARKWKEQAALACRELEEAQLVKKVWILDKKIHCER